MLSLAGRRLDGYRAGFPNGGWTTHCRVQGEQYVVATLKQRQVAAASNKQQKAASTMWCKIFCGDIMAQSHKVLITKLGLSRWSFYNPS